MTWPPVHRPRCGCPSAQYPVAWPTRWPSAANASSNEDAYQKLAIPIRFARLGVAEHSTDAATPTNLESHSIQDSASNTPGSISSSRSTCARLRLGAGVVVGHMGGVVDGGVGRAGCVVGGADVGATGPIIVGRGAGASGSGGG